MSIPNDVSKTGWMANSIGSDQTPRTGSVFSVPGLTETNLKSLKRKPCRIFFGLNDVRIITEVVSQYLSIMAQN